MILSSQQGSQMEYFTSMIILLFGFAMEHRYQHWKHYQIGSSQHIQGNHINMITLVSVFPSITIQTIRISIPEQPILAMPMQWVPGFRRCIFATFHLGPWYESEIPIKWNRMLIRVDTSISLHSLFYQDYAPYFKNDNINQLWDFQAETIDLLWFIFTMYQ